jgi:predicted dinucleotide-binding enzyme
VARRILVDATNRFPGSGPGAGSTEAIAAAYPGATVVKALNTMRWNNFGTPGGRFHYVAGDDPGANQRVAALIESLGFAVVDLGPLRDNARLVEPGGPLFNVSLTAAAT